MRAPARDFAPGVRVRSAASQGGYARARRKRTSPRLAADHAAENGKTWEAVAEDLEARRDRLERDPDYDSSLGVATAGAAPAVTA